MIHSEGDIKANEKATLLELISEMGSEIPEDINQQQAAEVETATNGIINAKKQNTTEVGEIKPNPGNKKVSDVSIDEFLATTREMCEYINKEGYDYCVLVTDAGNGEQQCHHAPVHGNPCGLPRTFLESQSSVSKHNFCCATLVSWALQNVGVMPDEAHLDGADSLAEWIVENLDPEQVNVGEELKPGDILCYEGHIDLVGEEVDGGFVKYNGGHYTEAGSVEFEGSSCIQKISGWPDDSRIKFALRLNWGDSQEGDTYEGYEGNEAVVSPVTGILLEYGTYTDEDIDSVSGEEYRTNVDLKYGSASALPGAEGEDGEEATNNSTGTSENTNTAETPASGEPQAESETEGGEIVADKVGYAKILVLDAENYQKLESKTGNRWQNDSLVKISEAKTSTNNEAALETDKSSARYLEKLETEEQMDEEHEKWNNLDKTIYGYKEFAESYEKYGMAGQIIYIDGFTCELPDESLSGGEEGSGETAEEGETAGGEIAEQIPEGEKLTIDSFKKVTAANLTGTEEPSEEDVLQSKYEKEDEYKLASKKATDKLNAESVVKDEANSSIYLEGEDLIFIKEGTVIGRTMTDREVVEKVRKDPPHPYEYYRPDASTSSTSGGGTGTEAETEEENEDKLIGNYIRIIMRDLDDTVVENVEDYMKLDEEGDSLNAVDQEYKAWEGDLEILAEGIYLESSYGYLSSMSELFRNDQEEADFEMYCMGYSIVNKLLEQNKQWYGHLYDENRTDMSPLAQVLTSSWYGVKEEMIAFINGGPSHYTEKELEYAEYCLTYDCTSIKKPHASNLSSTTVADGYTTTEQGTVIPRAMCQQGGYGDGAPGQSEIILVGFWDHDNSGDFNVGDELWGVDRVMEHLIEN